MHQLNQIKATIGDRHCRSTAIRVALIVGTLLFSINHGSALVTGEMNGDRWISGLLTYLVPFMVSIHGQSTCHIPEPKQ